MKQFTTILLLLTIGSKLCFSQTAFNVATYNPTPETFKYLLLKNSEIDANDTVNEAILDLVNPMLIDSVVSRKKEHHQVFLVGWLIHAFGGYNWRAITPVKQKFVGTAMHNSRSNEEQYTEYDINFDLNFHLKKYIDNVFFCYDCQKKTRRQDVRRSHHTDYDRPPFVRDTNNVDISMYSLHCELTPARNFRPQLHYLFYPTQPGLELKDHPNFGTARPSMGFYGVNCMDCNHNCHPEIHPYEWVWWLNLQASSSTAKTWLVGLFHESSNRFHEWSHNPMVGSITLPFAYQIKGDAQTELQVNVEHLVFNKFMDKEMPKLNVPDNAIGTKESSKAISFEIAGAAPVKGLINFKDVLVTDGLKYWFSNLNYDATNHILSGYLNMATAVKDLYTTKITFTEGVMP